MLTLAFTLLLAAAPSQDHSGRDRDTATVAAIAGAAVAGTGVATAPTMAGAAGAGSGGPTVTVVGMRTGARAVHYGSARDLDVPSPYVEAAEVRIDGRLDEGAWEAAAVLDGFTQYEPVEGVAASQRTEVRVLLTADALYFGVVAFDDAAGGIRATLAERDGYGRSDDYVRFVLDTFDDQRRAFVFQVNPLGVQADGLWVEGGGRGGPVDWNPDFLWESAGRVGPDRYVAEVRVPLKSLRFPDAPVQDWGLQVTRRIQRNGYEQSWAPITRERTNRLEQSGRLRGLRGLDPGLFLEINPFVTGSRVGAWDDGAGALRRDGASSELGFNVTYGLTSNLTLDGTYNPDFSQVEADAGRITVNERFAIRLPEKRPFFLEGTDVFSLPAQLVYTRSIVNPVGAAKLSGKVGGSSVAYVGAVDDAGPDGGRPVVNLLRVKHDLAGSNTVGVLYADRTRPGESFNRVTGADARFVFGGRYSLDVLAAGSADGETGRDTDWGSLLLARFARSGRSASLSASFEDVTPEFRARSGFIRRVGVTEAELRTGWSWRGGRGALVERWGPSLELEGTWDRDAFWSGRGPEEAGVELGVSGAFRGNVGGSVSWSRTRFSLSPEAYQGLAVIGADGSPAGAFVPSGAAFDALDGIRFWTWIGSWERVRASMGGSWGETPIYERSRGLPAGVGESWGANLDLTLYLTGSLRAEVGARHSTITRKEDGSVYSRATVPRLEARYQFSRALSVRATGEYALQERGAILDPVSGLPIGSCGADACTPQEAADRYDFSVEGLVSYEPSPGTVFFLGYSRQMRDGMAFRLQDVTTRADGLFVKLSYRVRL